MHAIIRSKRHIGQVTLVEAHTEADSITEQALHVHPHLEKSRGEDVKLFQICNTADVRLFQMCSTVVFNYSICSSANL